MNVAEFIEQQYELYNSSKISSFLDIYMYDCSERKIYLNRETEEIEYNSSKHCYYLVGDKRKIFFLLEVYKNTIFYHKEFAEYINVAFKNGLISTLCEILELEENGKVEKG